MGDTLGLGDALALGVGLWLAGGVALALGDAVAIGLAAVVWLGVPDAELTGLPVTADASLAAVAGRWAQALVALTSCARKASATAVPGKPPEMMNIPARMLSTTVWARRNITAAPTPRCPSPWGCPSSSFCWLITSRMSRTTHSLLSPFDTSGCARCHSPRGKGALLQAVRQATRRPIRTRVTS